MESYPDPTLSSRPPSYPYFLDSVATPESPPLQQNDNCTPPQHFASSEHQLGDFEDDVLRTEAYEHPWGGSEHPLGASVGISDAYDMPPPALPVPRKRRRLESGDAPLKRQMLPVVGVFRPPPPQTRDRSPLQATTTNANFTAKKPENAQPKHKNAREQTKSTIIYKENRRGKLVIQKYSYQRSGSVIAVLDKQQNSQKPPSSSQTQHQHQRLIPSLALPLPPPPHPPANQEATSHNYLHDLYRAFKRDFDDSSLPRITQMADTINPANLSMENSDNQQNERDEKYYFDRTAPPPSAPSSIQNNIIQQSRAQQAPHSGEQHVRLEQIITPGEQRGLASRSNYDKDVPGNKKVEKGSGHGVREFVELMNHEARNVAPNRERSMTSPRFADPPMMEEGEMDILQEESRGSAGSLSAPSASSGASVPSEAVANDETIIEDGTRWQSQLSQDFEDFEEVGHLQQHQNPFAFAPGEHLAHPHTSPPWWDGRDLTGFRVHLPDHSPAAQQALRSAYANTLQPHYDSVVVGSWDWGL